MARKDQTKVRRMNIPASPELYRELRMLAAVMDVAVPAVVLKLIEENIGRLKTRVHRAEQRAAASAEHEPAPPLAASAPVASFT
jgi:hypothetical protein